jgi:hypothetical protein
MTTGHPPRRAGKAILKSSKCDWMRLEKATTFSAVSIGQLISSELFEICQPSSSSRIGLFVQIAPHGGALPDLHHIISHDLSRLPRNPKA